MSDNDVHVPSKEYKNVRQIVHMDDVDVLMVKTDGMSGVDNANEHLLPETDDEDFSFDNVSNGYIGGVERVKLSAFSEDIGEVLAFVEEVKTNSHGYMSVNFSSSSNVRPTLRFHEKFGELEAVVTHRERL